MVTMTVMTEAEEADDYDDDADYDDNNHDEMVCLLLPVGISMGIRWGM